MLRMRPLPTCSQRSQESSRARCLSSMQCLPRGAGVRAGVGVALVVAAASRAYLAWPIVAGSAVKAIAFISGHIVPWLVAYATVALRGWLTLGHVGAVIAGALMTPERVAALVGVELVGILAFYALQRIAGSARFGDAQV